MAELEIKNATIESTYLHYGDRGFLDAGVTLDYGDGGHQGFGGYALYLPKSFTHHKLESVAGHFIYRLMEVAGVESWEHLRGRTVRVKSNWDKVQAIGHITKNDWFEPSVDFKAIK